jgi:hypothetical protein
MGSSSDLNESSSPIVKSPAGEAYSESLSKIAPPPMFDGDMSQAHNYFFEVETHFRVF